MADFIWPDGCQAAAALTFDVDAESAILSSAPAAADRMTVMSHQAYGPRVGVPRLLRMLERQDTKATFFVPGYTAERYPEVVRQIADQGHEVGHHGYLHETLVGVNAAHEEQILLRGLDVLEQVAGVRPSGYRAPMWELNYHSAALLHKHGFLYDSSLMDADVPYELAIRPDAPESIVEVPISWAADDWGQFCYLPDLSGAGAIESPSKTLEMWRKESEATHKEGGCFVLVNHPFLSGRPSRAAALEELLEYLKQLTGMWVTTMAALAEHARAQRLKPQTIDRPVVPA